jgi:hypothetical protein
LIVFPQHEKLVHELLHQQVLFNRNEDLLQNFLLKFLLMDFDVRPVSMISYNFKALREVNSTSNAIGINLMMIAFLNVVDVR